MLQVFNSPEGQEIRVVEKDGEPWFVAADVARALGYRDAFNMTRRLDDDDKGTHSTSTPSGQQEMTVVSEPGLYGAILGSQVPGAKAFKYWLTHDVLPALRKGKLQAKQLSRKDLALMVVAAEEQIEALTLRVQQLDEYAQEAEVYIEEAEPAVAFQALVQSADEGSLGSLELSAFLHIPNRTMLAKMRAARIIMRSGFVPTTDHRNRFESRVNVYENPRTGKESTSVTWLFKMSGTPWLLQRLASVTSYRRR